MNRIYEIARTAFELAWFTYTYKNNNHSIFYCLSHFQKIISPFCLYLNYCLFEYKNVFVISLNEEFEVWSHVLIKIFKSISNLNSLKLSLIWRIFSIKHTFDFWGIIKHDFKLILLKHIFGPFYLPVKHVSNLSSLTCRRGCWAVVSCNSKLFPIPLLLVPYKFKMYDFDFQNGLSKG